MNKSTALEIYKKMLRIRYFEEKLDELFHLAELPGFVHLYIGEEAIASGVCAALKEFDCISSTHRGHGHLIAKGADMNTMMAELLGKQNGICKGRGGSMHIVDFNLGIIGTNGIVGGGIPLAVGAAWGNAWLGKNAISVAFFGDGAANQGVLLESMNLAAIWKAPVIFICENNLYSEWSRGEQLTAGKIYERGLALGIPGILLDGNDAEAVYQATCHAAERARKGDGPTLIEAKTWRWSGHNLGEEAFSGNYRSTAEDEYWRSKDPIPRFAKVLVDKQFANSTDLQFMAEQEQKAVVDAVDFARNSPCPAPEDALLHIFAEPVEHSS